jgi:hypothetical protein
VTNGFLRGGDGGRITGCSKDSEVRRAKFDELRRTLQYVEASRASTPFDNAQGSRHMRLFSGLLS